MIAIGLVISVYDEEVKKSEEEIVEQYEERRNDLRVIGRRWQPK